MQLAAALTLLRPRQWVKNGFVAAPLFFTPSAVSLLSIPTVAAGVGAFCLLSSAMYIINDFADRETDQQHPEKRYRPLAAGTVSTTLAAGLVSFLLAAGITIAVFLGPRFLWYPAAYVLLNVAYSLRLKRVAIVDVLVVAIGFILRVYGGAVLIDVVPTTWILVCTGLLALFLALAKRRDDLEKGLGGDHRASLSGYTKEFLDSAITLAVSALLIAYIIYTTDVQVAARLGTEQLYITVPFVVAGILRYLQITLVEKGSSSPTHLILHDRFLKVAILGWLVTFGFLIYG